MRGDDKIQYDCKENYIFIYGVLQRGPGGCINCALTKSGIFIGNGTFRGKLYKIGHYPGAIPSDGESDRVKGDVYLLPNPDAVLESLDRFEGWHYTMKGLVLGARTQESSTGTGSLSIWRMEMRS